MDRMTELWRVIERAVRAFGLLAGLMCVVLCASPAAANPKYAGLVVDVISGKTLYADNADKARFPASLTKIMTLYIVFEEIDAGRITLETRFRVSKYAAARPPSKIGFKPGGTIKVRDAIKALVTKSANDVATAIAENISGSEAAFAKRMTATAKRLGMNSTTFRNASGLPNAQQVTTARDMAKLGIAIQRDFPRFYGVFETRVFNFRKRGYRNHNRLLGRVEGVDGIKTGYIRASGFNLVTSVRRDGRHIVAVVMGGRTGASRNKHMTSLIGRTLPKATRGTPMKVYAWNDRGPAPLPRAKPADALLVARLRRAAEPEPGASDELAGLLAFASETRAAAPRLDTLALKAVIVQASTSTRTRTPTQAAPDAPVAVSAAAPVVSAYAPHSETIRVPAVDGPQGEMMAAAGAMGLSAPAGRNPSVGGAGPGASRFSDAFEEATLDAGASHAGLSGLERALERAVDRPRETVQIGSRTVTSAPGPGGPGVRAPERRAGLARESVPAGWQIQLGAVPSAEAAAALHEAAEGMAPDLKARTRLTSEVETADGALYRARFGGFETKRQADEACKRFAHHNRPCWTVSM